MYPSAPPQTPVNGGETFLSVAGAAAAGVLGSFGSLFVAASGDRSAAEAGAWLADSGSIGLETDQVSQWNRVVAFEQGSFW